MKSYEIEVFIYVYILMALLCKVVFFFLSILLGCRSAEEADVWCQWFLKKQFSLKEYFILKHKMEQDS